jgi:hypothetical protein
MKHRSRILALPAAIVAMVMATTAVVAHPDHMGAREAEHFNGEGITDDRQHGPPDGHLPARNDNVKLIGKAALTAPAGTNGDMTGRVADVAAYGNYAYLTAFSRDAADCVTGGGGAWIVDISDPANPAEVGFLPTTPGNYAGEGSQVITAEFGPFVGHQLFIHQNETCPGAPAGGPGTRGGINIWDVSDPLSPVLLVAHAGDTDGTRPNPNTVHSAYAWNSHLDGKVYAVLVDNAEFNDVDIMDITDPTSPVMVNDALDLWTAFGVQQSAPSNLTSVFNHDMMVYRKGERYLMNVNYWDGGYVILDVTNPTPGNVTLVAESDYAMLDEERLARGHEISPEGNAHQSEFSPDFKYLIGTDEDFNPYRVVATITSGPYDGTAYTAVSASGTPPIDEDTTVAGTPTFVGLACDALPAGTGIALVERGVCAFQVKLDNIRAAGYTSGIVFNNQAGCQALVTMLAAGDIPYVFVTRLTGLQLLGVPGVNATNACATATPAAGSPSASTTIEAIFDGWGYVRLFRTKVPAEPGQPGSIKQVDTYALPESQSPDYATGFGALSVHEVAMDPRPGSNLAYLSYYSGGFRVLKFNDKGMTEVGAFIDDGGNDFWGVEVHEHPNGQHYVLASDRDFGLYIFQYAGKIRGGG